MDKRIVRDGGMGIASFLAIMFVILKVTGIISWSWILVLSPIWIPVICSVIILGIILVSDKIAHK